VKLTTNFSLWEFGPDLTQAQVIKARFFASQLLQPARYRFDERLGITSFIRSAASHRGTVSDTHRNGDAVDVVLLDWPKSREGSREKHRELARWLATYHPQSFGKVIHELARPHQSHDHLHITLPGVQGATGELWLEVEDGSGRYSFQRGHAPPATLAGVVVLGAVLLLAAVALFH
jgi:hypothetical protein